MNKKYLIGLELYLMQCSKDEDDDKLSFELLKEISEFFMRYYNVMHVKFMERSEATLTLTIEPMEVKLTSTGNDKVFKKITKNFQDIYSKLCLEFGCKQLLNFVSPIYFTLSPRCLGIKNETLTIYRECFEDLDVNLNDMAVGYYYEIFKEDIKKCREHYERHVVTGLNVGNFNNEQEESFYKVIELAVKDEFGEIIREESEPF